MSVTSASNKRLAKNTILLYFRMLLTMAVSLYTSRIVLNVLGIEDFGIYNVVGGIVVVLSFLNSAMAGATQRYLNIELGRKDDKQLRKVFSTSLLIHLGISVVILLLAETVGLWFLNTYLNIPAGRLTAANWVYQFSIAAFIVSIISVPYNATIIAHERMSAFAYISILEVLLKLAIVFMLTIASFDKLIFYAFLIFLTGVIIRIVYGLYCNKKFEECRVESWSVDKPLLKNMLSFSSWTILGNLSYIFHTQGVSIVMNVFFGATINAAQGIANQVNTVVKGFMSNFLQALNPQIVKTYAENDLSTMHKLILRGSRISYFLVAIFAFPLILEAPMILKIWLNTFPDYSIIFVRLVLCLSLCESFSGLLSTAQGATGKIKIYQILMTSIGLTHLPLSYLFYWLGYEPQAAFYVYLVIICVLQIVRVTFVCRSIGLSLRLFFNDVLFRCLMVTVVALVIPLFLHVYLVPSLGSMVLICFVCVVAVMLSALLLGLTQQERIVILSNLKNKIKR